MSGILATGEDGEEEEEKGEEEEEKGEEEKEEEGTVDTFGCLESKSWSKTMKSSPGSNVVVLRGTQVITL